MDVFSALWLADYAGSFLSNGGKGLYYFHYLPLQMEHGCNDSPGTFGMFTVDANYQIQQDLAQYFAAQLINQEWVQPGNGEQHVFPAKSDISDGAGHALVTSYALHRPDGEWSLLIVNRDQLIPHSFRVTFHDDTSHVASSFTGEVEVSIFGSQQYHWYPAVTTFMAHSEHVAEQPVIVNTQGYADPDGPALHSTNDVSPNSTFEIPPASIMVVRGKVEHE
jgi:hypothetical protein